MGQGKMSSDPSWDTDRASKQRTAKCGLDFECEKNWMWGGQADCRTKHHLATKKGLWCNFHVRIWDLKSSWLPTWDHKYMISIDVPSFPNHFPSHSFHSSHWPDLLHRADVSEPKLPHRKSLHPPHGSSPGSRRNERKFSVVKLFLYPPFGDSFYVQKTYHLW